MSEIKAAEVQAHGMGTTLVRPDWAPITLEEANQLLSRYPDLEPASALTWHSPRPFSSATIAATFSESLFIKRHHHSVRDKAGLTEEHRLIRHLRDRGIPVSDIITGASGQTAFEIGEWTYEIHRLAKGVDLYRDAVSWSPFLSEAHAYAAGDALARVHLAAEGYDAPPRAGRQLVSSFSIFGSADPRAAMAAYIGQRKALSDYIRNRPWEQDLETVFMPLFSRLEPWLGELEPLWTHNDWHASNLLWSDAELTGGTSRVETILDFGLADRTNAVYDLATAIERNAIEWLALEESDCQNVVHYEQLEALLNGYETIRPLRSEEAAALVAMLPLVHAEFALSEIDYFTGIVGSVSNADIAYDTFLLGHAKWFASPTGQQLLAFLEQRYGIQS
ncbi:phosphotransferase enzyme family protein [Paenibacillus sp. NPDC058174]|uniref:phosphotransferase enzyme family protein n=1 Tax=Paenibacillus sp. NPDC058174 TaxID=3346366 RepID=UPI0036DCC340